MLLVACVGVGTKNKTLTFFGGGVSRFKDTDGRYESGRRMPSWKISFVLKTLNQFDKKNQKNPSALFKKALLLLLRSLHIHALDRRRRRRKKILAERSHSRTGECWGRGRCNDTTVRRRRRRRRQRAFFFFLTSSSSSSSSSSSFVEGTRSFLKKGTPLLKEEGTKGAL